MSQKNLSYDLDGQSYNRSWFIWVLLLGSFTMSISQSSLSTAYPTLMNFFGIQATTVQWLTTGFMLIMCVMMPVSPWLLNNMKFKNLFIMVLLMFDVGTLIIYLAQSFPVMMFGRILEAAAVGILFPSYQSVLMYITPKENRGTVMGFAGLIMGSALACGPIISGIVLKFTTWRGLFVFFMVVITIVFILSLFKIKNVMPQNKGRLDILSVIFSIGFIGILYVVNMIGKNNVNLTSALIILIISIIAVILFIYRQLTIKEPLLNLHVLKNFNYDLSVCLTGISYIALIVTTIIFPLYYQDILGLSPFASGISLVPGAALLSILNPLTGTLADKIGFKKTMLIGMFMIVLGWLLLSVLSFNLLSLPIMIILAMLIEGGNAFVMMPATTLGGNSLPKDLISHGTAVTTTLRQILGSTGVAVATLILTNITQSKISGGMSNLAANHSGFKVVFVTFFILEIVGIVMAFMIRNNAKEGQK